MIQSEGFDIDGVLAFAETAILDARRLWSEADLGGRSRLQSALVPRGDHLRPCEAGFRTDVTCLAFSRLRAIQAAGEEVASPRGILPFAMRGAVVPKVA